MCLFLRLTLNCFKAALRLPGSPRATTVAALQVRDGDVAAEAATLLKLGKHPRLVTFLGQCKSTVAPGADVILITEFAPMGSLDSVSRSHHCHCIRRCHSAEPAPPFPRSVRAGHRGCRGRHHHGAQGHHHDPGCRRDGGAGGAEAHPSGSGAPVRVHLSCFFSLLLLAISSDCSVRSRFCFVFIFPTQSATCWSSRLMWTT